MLFSSILTSFQRLNSPASFSFMDSFSKNLFLFFGVVILSKAVNFAYSINRMLELKLYFIYFEPYSQIYLFQHSNSYLSNNCDTKISLSNYSVPNKLSIVLALASGQQNSENMHSHAEDIERFLRSFSLDHPRHFFQLAFTGTGTAAAVTIFVHSKRLHAKIQGERPCKNDTPQIK